LKHGESFDFSDVITSSKNFSIIEMEFILERKNGNEISIEIFENTRNVETVLRIGLHAGNYFDVIKIVQSPD